MAGQVAVPLVRRDSWARLQDGQIGASRCALRERRSSDHLPVVRTESAATRRRRVGATVRSRRRLRQRKLTKMRGVES